MSGKKNSDELEGLFWFEGMTPEQMHWHIVALQAGYQDRQQRKPKRPLEFWGIGQQWIDEVRERWGELPELEIRRRAEILKKVDRIEKSTTIDERTKAGRIGGLMASASRTPEEASEKSRAAQHERWVNKGREEFPDDTPEEQARKAKVLKRIQEVNLQMASLKARYKRKRGKTEEDTQRYRSQVAKLRGRLAGLTLSLQGDAKVRTEKARGAFLARLRQQAVDEDPNRTPEEIEARTAELQRERMREIAGRRRKRQ